MPYLGSTIFIVTLVVGVALAMNGYFLLVRGLWPGLSEQTKLTWQEHPFRTLFVGAFFGGMLFVMTAVLLSLSPGIAKAAGMLVGTLGLGVALIGTAGLAGRLGAGLASPSDASSQWRQTMRGGIVLELCFLMPLLGWFVVLPLALIGGFGATLLALVFPIRRQPDLPAPLQLVSDPPPSPVAARRAESS